jgi:hypothetical protein
MSVRRYNLRVLRSWPCFKVCLIPGKEDDHSPERPEAIRIVQECRRSSVDCTTFSEAGQATLVTVPQDNCNTRERETDIVGEPQVQPQDIRTSIDKIAAEVSVV